MPLTRRHDRLSGGVHVLDGTRARAAHPELIERSYAERITLQVLAAELDHAPYVCAVFRAIEAVALLVAYRSKKNFYQQFERWFA